MLRYWLPVVAEARHAVRVLYAVNEELSTAEGEREMERTPKCLRWVLLRGGRGGGLEGSSKPVARKQGKDHGRVFTHCALPDQSVRIEKKQEEATGLDSRPMCLCKEEAVVVRICESANNAHHYTRGPCAAIVGFGFLQLGAQKAAVHAMSRSFTVIA